MFSQGTTNETESSEPIESITSISPQNPEPQEIRRRDAEERIVDLIRGFPHFRSSQEEDTHMELYARWVKQSLTTGKVIQQRELLRDNPLLKFNFSRDLQEGDKNSTSVSCKHLPTNITVEGTNAKDIGLNMNEAVAQLEKALSRHIADWEMYINPQKGQSPTPEQISEITPELLLPLMLKAQEPKIEKAAENTKTQQKQVHKKRTQITDAQLESWRDEPGHISEEQYVIALKKLGFTELKEGTPPEEHLDMPIFTRATATEDFEEGFDFKFYDPKTNKWILVDLTTASNPEVLNQKKEKERRTGIRLLQLPSDIIDNASKGSQGDLREVLVSTQNIIQE